MNMNDILMLEWINICETFLEDHPPQHDEYDDDEWVWYCINQIFEFNIN